MTKLKQILKYVFAFLFISGGIMHFVKPELYLPMMPSYLPAHLELIYLSGVAELAVGVGLLIARFQKMAAWGSIALLVAVFPANINMALHPEQFPQLNPTGLWIRLPIQFLLMAWGYWYTKPDKQA